MRRRRSWWSCALVALHALVLVLVGAPTTAHAEDVAEARKHFAEGVTRYQDGDFEGARVLFQKANAEHHAPAIVYNIGRAEERLGHPQAAVDAYDEYIAEAGEKGELTQAAVVSVARIRASARQLYIETKPAGARVFIDGTPTRDPAPTRVLVPAGRHHVVAEGDGWRAEADVEPRSTAVETVTLVQPEATRKPKEPAEDPPPTPTPSPAPSSPPPLAPPLAPTPEVSDGFVLGAEFMLVPHRFDVTGERKFSSIGLAAGPMVELGYAPAESFVVLARGLFAVGSKGAPATTLAAVGLGFSFRVSRALWLGAAMQGGRALLPGAFNPAPNEQRRFDTDYVFCPTLELSVAVLTRPYGQWLVSVMPGYYFASPTDNDVFFVPIGFGLRTF